jgi:hypothetical protein
VRASSDGFLAVYPRVAQDGLTLINDLVDIQSIK